MRNSIVFLLSLVFLCTGCNTPSGKSAKEDKTDGQDSLKIAVAEAGQMNELTDQEKTEGWILMFDGKTPDGWRGINKTAFPSTWIIEDGTLRCQGTGNDEVGVVDGGDILYDKQLFSDFHLKMEWKISKGGNSGVFYLGKEVEGWPIYKTAPEMQILDNENNPDALLGQDGNRKAGSLYDLIPAKPQNAKPAGEWNSAEIICYKGNVVHKQNGEIIVEYHLWTPEWNELVKDSKFPGLNSDWANVPKEGIIALQDRGNDVWFRNIKVRPL